MPFVSKAQEARMFANKPEIAKERASVTNQSSLPERVHKKSTKIKNIKKPKPLHHKKAK